MNTKKDKFYKNKRAAVTGAAGSIGSAVVAFLLENGATVCALDNSEDGLFQLGKKNQEYMDTYKLRLFLGDIRDKIRLELAFEDVNIVIHAAALKHVEMSELNVFDCIKTNVNGVDNVVRAALKNNVEYILFTSSDKAVNPSSTMGTSKLIGEKIFTAANNIKGSRKCKFSSVRFGNVIKSNGSVLTVFNNKIKNNKPLPITDEKMTRFFLTINNAIELIDYAIKNMTGGEIFVKNMGSASILKLAEAYIGNSNFKFEIIGTKPGEKLYEELITDIESNRTFLKDGFYYILPEIITSDKINIKYQTELKNMKISGALVSTNDDMSIQDLKQLLNET